MQINIIAALFILFVLLFRTITINHLPKSILLVLWGIVFIRLWFPIMVPLPPDTPIATGFTNAAQTIHRAVQTSASTVNFAQENRWLPTLMTTIWLAGAIFLFLGFFVLYVFQLLHLSDAIPLQENELPTDFLAKQKLHRNVRILRSDKIRSPISYGVFRPRILLPSNMELSDTETLQFVLQHEIFHIRRLDVIWKAAVNCTVCLYWFNPAIWVYLFCVNRDLETSCDEYVLKKTGIQSREQYANSLVKMAQKQAGLAQSFQGFSHNALAERVVAVMYFKKTSVWAITLCFAVTLASITAFAFAPDEMDFSVSSISQYCNPGSILSVGADGNLYIERAGTASSNVASRLTSSQQVGGSSTSVSSVSETTADTQTHMPNREPGMRYVYDGGKALIKITNEDSSLYYFPGDSDTPAEYRGSTWLVIDPAVNPAQKGVAFNLDTSAGMQNALAWVAKYVSSTKQKGITSSLKAQEGSKCTIYYEWAVS